MVKQDRAPLRPNENNRPPGDRRDRRGATRPATSLANGFPGETPSAPAPTSLGAAASATSPAAGAVGTATSAQLPSARCRAGQLAPASGRAAARRIFARLAPAALTLLLAALAAGCSGANAGGGNKPLGEDSPSPIVTASPTATPEPTPTPAPYTAPLTGLPLDHEATERPIAVMVNNMSLARPQSGLPHADMVWEVLAEGGITRLVAVFQSDDFADPIGPIRSNRPYLIDIGDSYNAVLAHSGASTDGYDILQHQGKAYLDEITNAGAYFWRESFRKPPHNLYSDLEKLRAGAASKKYKESVVIPSYPFSETGATALGAPATQVEMHFLLKDYKVSYTYDEASKLYKRFIDGEPHTDLTTKEQLSAANLVVIGAKHRTYDDYGRLEIDLTSGGPAVLMELGKAVECTWERAPDGAIRLMKDGKELPFVPGHTFYHIMPMTPSFESHFTYGGPATGEADAQSPVPPATS